MMNKINNMNKKIKMHKINNMDKKIKIKQGDQDDQNEQDAQDAHNEQHGQKDQDEQGNKMIRAMMNKVIKMKKEFKENDKRIEDS